MRSERLKVNLTPETIEKLNSVVEQQGLSRTGLIYRAIMEQQAPSRTELIRQVISAQVSFSDYQDLDLIIVTAQEKGLEPERVKAKIRETPFAGFVEVLPKDRAQLYAFLALLIAIVQLVVSLRSTTPTITPDQVEEIIERILDHDQPASPPSVPPSAPTAPPVPSADHK